MLITDRHLYKMDPLKQYKPMKTLPLYNVGHSIHLTGFYLHTQAGKPKTAHYTQVSKQFIMQMQEEQKEQSSITKSINPLSRCS